MENFGLLNRVNGMEELPFWKGSCNSIKASEGNAKNLNRPNLNAGVVIQKTKMIKHDCIF